MEWILGTSDLRINGANAKSLVSRCEQSAIGGMVKACECGRYERRACACVRRSIVSGKRRPLRFGQSIEIVDRSRIKARRRTLVGNGRRRAFAPGPTARHRSKSRLTDAALCSNPRSAGFAEIEKQRSDAESSAPIDFRATLR
ncbi:hypothetical protein [Burkholderia multivorans]|uniref:hypothetical protein n=1 Tax=Burkholderia multivorans TaxID=87883 RepID=UPI0012D2EC2C|nr:hypothetical protein [Burkholderia multivorans]